jgi:hypothetical protein
VTDAIAIQFYKQLRICVRRASGLVLTRYLYKAPIGQSWKNSLGCIVGMAYIEPLSAAA